MSEIQNQQILHAGDESPLIPDDGTLPDLAAEDYAAIRVHVTNAGGTDAIKFGTYVTVTIPASSAGVPSVEPILPSDPLRQYAFVLPVDEAIVVSTQPETVQAAGNAGTAQYPAGALLPGGLWSPAILSHDPLYAANTSITAACRVTVIIGRGK